MFHVLEGCAPYLLRGNQTKETRQKLVAHGARFSGVPWVERKWHAKRLVNGHIFSDEHR